jgi:acyl-CoA synthetase (AMP-forming)/AMP-acid ligase II
MQTERKPTADEIARFENAGYWRNRTLTDYFDEALARHPARVAVAGLDGQRLTYAALGDRVDRVVAHLWAAGIRPGDVISVQLPNWVEFAIIHLAATWLGAITNPLLPNYRSKELSHILDFAGTKAVFIPKVYRGVDFPAMYAKLRPKLRSLEHIYVVGGHAGMAMTSFETLLTPPSHPAPSLPRPGGNDVTILIFTSGTESTPKGVMHSHNTALFTTIALSERFGLGPDEVIWTPSPLGHGSGFQWGLRLAIALGGTLVLQDIWDPEAGLDLIEREGCTFVYAATPFVSMLLDARSVAGRSLRLRIFGCGGAPIPSSIGEAVRDRMNCRLIGTWGMTECFVASASAPGDADRKCWTTDGRALPGVEIAVFDEARTRRLDAGEIGEFATRGPHVSLGYFNDPARTRQTFTEQGWLFSGDLATMDDDGYVRLVGRKKDVINRGGLKFSACEIEELLCTHPNVREAAIVGVPDTRLGEKSCAFIVSAGPVALDELTRLLEQRGVAKFKLPEYIVLVNALPLTASGKVQKFVLRDGFTNGSYPPLQGAPGLRE